MKIFFLDDDVDLRETMTELLQALAHEVVSAHDLAEMVALDQTVLACHLAILDVNLGEAAKSGLDALEWLEERRYAGSVAFLTGHAQAWPAVREAVRRSTGEAVRVLEKPITFEQLRRLLDELGP